MSAVDKRLLALPGFVNAHSHAFQRALRGRAEGGDFWAWRDMMLAEAERQTPETVRASYVGDIHRDARSWLHGRGRVPLPRLRGGACRGRRRARGLDRAHPAPVRLRARRPPPVPPGVAGRLPGAGRGAARPGPARRRRPPLRPRLSSGLARGDRPLRRGREPAAARPRRRAAARDRGVPRRARRPADRAARRRRAAWGRTRRSSTRPTRAMPSSTCSPTRAPVSASVRRPRRTSATGSSRSLRCASAASGSASAPTRTSGSTRSRSCASSKGSPAGPRASAT